jgi:hypothetical protein
LAFNSDRLIGTADERQIVNSACGFNTGKGANALQDLGEELGFFGRRFELMARNLEGHGERVAGIKAGIDSLKIPEATEHESRADEEHDGEGDFDGDKRRAV